MSSQQKDSNLVASYDSTVGEVQDVLETLINQGQHAWVPYISTWSIKTLGVLSKKYKRSDNRGKLIVELTISNCIIEWTK